jgi:hypothetical protein
MLRDCAAWLKNDNIKMNTTSNEACKLYDCALTQVVTWRELDDYGGLERTIANMLEADSEFFLGHILRCGLELIGSSTKPHPSLIPNLTELKTRQEKNLTEHELLHYSAMIDISNGNLYKACDKWESILIDKPFDMMALRFANNAYFYTGNQAQLRDSLARVIPLWNKSKPLYSYLFGMYSFGLIQSNYFEEAKKAALHGLELNKEEAWSTHTICHYNEYKCNPDAGIKFLRDTELDWSRSNLLAMHNYWHMCLYHLERDEHDIVLHIFDNVLTQRLKRNISIDFFDLVSLLYRLELDMTKFDLSERWARLESAYKPRFEDHGYLFNDIHTALLLGNKTKRSKNEAELKSKFLQSFKSLIESDNHNNENYLINKNKELGKKLFDGIFNFQEGNYDLVVDDLYPIRYEILKIGGSNAQRDVLNQVILQAALRSTSAYHNKIGMVLMNEREALRPNCKLTQRMKARFAVHHTLDD